LNRRVSDREWNTAGEIGWENYYRWVEGRELRQVFVDSLPLLPDPTPVRDRVAVDLGCGDGKEALVLLERGWTVLAVDGAPEGIARLLDAVPPDAAERLTTKVASFAEVELPAADLVYAGFSLPFCDPEDFGSVWSRIVEAVRPGGLFAGNFFGPRDTWFGTPDMTFHSRDEVEGLVADFDVVSVREEDEDGSAASGPKHWHVFHAIARKRA
jgi:SAM-dependent methyltransferase